MADGTAKNIEDVTEDDQVLSWDPDQGRNTVSRVARTFVHDKVATLRVTTEAGELVTTTNHPFYVEHKGWTPAGELTEGDRLRGPDGGTVAVTCLQATGTMETVHNLGVAGTHNYYVRTGATWALAHNSGTPSKTCTEVTQKVQELAQAEADKGVKALRDGLTRAQKTALEKEPWLEKMFAGTTIHKRVADALDGIYGDGAIPYNSNNGPDFKIPKELSGADVDEYVELTTGGQVPAHQRRAAKNPLYEDAQYAEYEFRKQAP